jgi:hypothetical protein
MYGDSRINNAPSSNGTNDVCKARSASDTRHDCEHGSSA